MQLSHSKKLTAALAAATCSLLNAPVQAQEQSEWEFDTALLYYGETDRVTAVEGVFNAKKDFGDSHIFNGKLVIDTLTGASANGAVPQPYAQTFTRPSGEGGYTIKAGEVPLDDTFRDTRVQLNAQWTQPLMQDLTGSAGVHLSKEYDYLSLAVNGSLAQDFNKKNTTLSAALSFAYDTINPEGGIPNALSPMALNSGYSDDDEEEYEHEVEFDDDSFDDDFNSTRLTDSDSKTTVDVMFGLTQVLSRRLLLQANYGYSQVDGYMTDPFKVLSVVNTEGQALDYLYESRPDSRTRHSVFLQGKYAMDYGVADLSYRFVTDDWDIDSHTIDSRLRFNLGEGHYIQPHVRYYTQSAANFYQPFLNETDTLPQYASADYRIGELNTYTLGLKYGMPLYGGDEISFRLEYYHQQPKDAGFDAPGVLQDLDLYPAVKAVVFQVSYHF